MFDFIGRACALKALFLTYVGSYFMFKKIPNGTLIISPLLFSDVVSFFHPDNLRIHCDICRWILVKTIHLLPIKIFWSHLQPPSLKSFRRGVNCMVKGNWWMLYLGSWVSWSFLLFIIHVTGYQNCWELGKSGVHSLSI